MNIPSIDLADFRSYSEERKRKFVLDIGKSFNEVGFVAVKSHGLDKALQTALYTSTEVFFNLPQPIKETYSGASLNGQRGYTGKGQEHAKDSKHGDLKEFYHVGQINPDSGFTANIWPQEIKEFQDAQTAAYQCLEQTGAELLRAIALYLDLDEHYFDEKVIGGNSILRSIHYYPIHDTNIKPGAVRAAAHGDINLITLLMGASAEGLEILNRNNEWIPVTALEDHIVVNVGDMLARLTNDKLKSTIHRVVNPSKEKMNTSRYSIPFFMHPKPAMDLACLPSCVDAQHPKQYEDITAIDFLMQRLEEIGLVAK